MKRGVALLVLGLVMMAIAPPPRDAWFWTGRRISGPSTTGPITFTAGRGLSSWRAIPTGELGAVKGTPMDFTPGIARDIQVRRGRSARVASPGW